SSDSDQEKSWDSGQDKGDHDKGSGHEKPNGGMHTGGGALTTVTNDDWSKGDKEKDSSSSEEEKSWDSGQDKGDKGSWDEHGKDEEEKPHGGMHTGGGGLATPGVTAGGIAVLGLAAAGVYTVRRRNAEGGVA
ncbi:hypothetical protein AB0885_42800, partial [Streptomyces sp. NPDC005534]